MLVVEVVVEFDHAVVAVADRRVGGEIVAGLRGQIVDVAGPEVRRHLLRDWTLWNTVGCQQREGVSLIGLRRLGIQTGKTDGVLLLLERKKPESFVLDNRTAQRETKVLIPQGRLRVGYTCRECAGVEERSGGAKSSIAIEVVGAAVKLVGARL